MCRAGMRGQRQTCHGEAYANQCASGGGPHGVIMVRSGCQFADMDQPRCTRSAAADARKSAAAGCGWIQYAFYGLPGSRRISH
jgi:hypothetical protein